MNKLIDTTIKWLDAELTCNREVLSAEDVLELESTIEALKQLSVPTLAEDLHSRVQIIKDLGVRALITQDDVAKARYDLMFWSLMNNHGLQILDILDDALQAHEEGKI